MPNILRSKIRFNRAAIHVGNISKLILSSDRLGIVFKEISDVIVNVIKNCTDYYLIRQLGRRQVTSQVPYKKNSFVKMLAKSTAIIVNHSSA